jgi:hypothetical protein
VCFVPERLEQRGYQRRFFVRGDAIFGPVEVDFGYTDRGKFTPPVAIDDHCWTGSLWPDHVVRLMAIETVRVKEVTFADGSTWKAGMSFVRAYGNGGTPLPRPIVVESVTPSPSPTPLPSPSPSL